MNPVEKYISQFPPDIQEKLNQLRSVIRKSAPEAEEMISYAMPCFKWNGPLVYFAVHQSHIGFYPTASPIQEFKNELTGYKTSKGAVQFPISQPIPFELVEMIVRYKVEENLKKRIRNKR